MTSTSRPAILGGDPVRSAPTFPMRRTMGDAEREIVARVVDSDVLSAYLGSAGAFFLGGEQVRAVEDKWGSRYGFEHVITVNSWTTGLMVAMGAVGVQPGDEVICPPYTMSASASAAAFYGGIPVFADIEADTFCLDPAAFEAAITPRTRAVVVVHLFGGPARMDPILEIARRHGVKVIEDAAQAPGVMYRGRPVGAIGDVGGFSLNYHKHIHAGEGGVLVTQDAEIARICQLVRNHGENAVTEEEVSTLPNFLGSNYRLSELHAGIANVQLDRLQGYLDTRMRLAAHMEQRLDAIEGLTPPRIEEGSTHAFYLYPIRYDAAVIGLSRRQFVQAVGAELPKPAGFETTPLAEGYVKPLYLLSMYQQQRALGRDGYPWAFNPDITYDYRKGLCPVAERMYERELLLSPMVREPLTMDDMDALADAMEKVAAHAPAIRHELGEDAGGEVYTPVSASNATATR